MANSYVHGVQVLEIDSGPRPITTLASSVIGLVGTAPNSQPATPARASIGTVSANNSIDFVAVSGGLPSNLISIALVNPSANSATLGVVVTGTAIVVNLGTSSGGAITSTAAQVITAIGASSAAAALVTAANTSGSSGASAVAAVAATLLSGGLDEPFPLNTPVLIAANQVQAAKLGTGGTLLNSINSILNQVSAAIVVVRVAVGGSSGATLTNCVGSPTSKTGVHALENAESVTGVHPRILICPTYSASISVGSELIAVAEKLRGFCFVDGPNTDDATAITYAANFGSARATIVDPTVTVFVGGQNVQYPGSAFAAGIMAQVDNDLGFWYSPSNKPINGIVGTGRPISFSIGDANTSANLMNSYGIQTVIQQNGFRLWGDRTLSADPKFSFISVRRTADLIEDSIQRAHLWAVDKNITRTYLKDVAAGVNAYLRTLTSLGAILGGRCSPDPDLNTPANIKLGKVYFNYDFTPPYPAEQITFQASIVDTYITNLTK